MKETKLAFVNEKFVPEEQAAVSIFDRGFLYGDGLFATIRVCNGRPFRWRRHMLRIHRGANFLRINIPVPDAKLREYATELIRLNNMPDSILRLTISRGIGRRGYSPKMAATPTITMSLRPFAETNGPPIWRLRTSSFTLRSSDPLAYFKSCNRLVQVLARAEADEAGFDEALLLNDGGYAVETASGNLFWIDEESVCTAPLGAGILPGVTRSVIFEVCEALGRRVQEGAVTREQLLQAQGAFASMSSLGVVEISAIDETVMPRAEFVAAIREAYEDVVRWETITEIDKTQSSKH